MPVAVLSASQVFTCEEGTGISPISQDEKTEAQSDEWLDAAVCCRGRAPASLLSCLLDDHVLRLPFLKFSSAFCHFRRCRSDPVLLRVVQGVLFYM